MGEGTVGGWPQDIRKELALGPSGKGAMSTHSLSQPRPEDPAEVGRGGNGCWAWKEWMPTLALAPHQYVVFCLSLSTFPRHHATITVSLWPLGKGEDGSETNPCVEG